MAVPGAITAVGAPGWGLTASLARVVGRIVGGGRRESGPQPEQEHVGRSKNPAPPQQRVYGRAALASNGAGSAKRTAVPPCAPARATAVRTYSQRGSGMSSTQAPGAQHTPEPVVDPEQNGRAAGAFLPTRGERHAASW